LRRSEPSTTPEPGPSAREALERARAHARNALREAVAAARALLDAGALAATGVPARSQPGLDALARGLDAWSQALDGAADGPAAPLVDALADALDAEIERWEQRAADGDADARAVLRAFLGLREILWEMGVRRAARSSASAGRGDTAMRRARVRRVVVQG
jgi:hypothetical protein